MKITIQSTTTLDTVNNVPARVWEGETDSGVPVVCLITRVAVKKGLPPEAYAQFERELQCHEAPRSELGAIPLRMVL
jgi:hypothetical protein